MLLFISLLPRHFSLPHLIKMLALESGAGVEPLQGILTGGNPLKSAVNLKVLLVDDDSDLRELFTEALRERGYYAEAACCAEEALEKLAKDAFDVVACDMVMPGMDGIELIKRIRRFCKGVEPPQEVLIIMITGDGAIETASKAIEAGAFGYMTKPFRFDEFLIIMKSAAERLALMSENSMLRNELKLAHAEITALKKPLALNIAGSAAPAPLRERPGKGKKGG